MIDIDKKFPPERKNEFLNWLMVTQDRNDWCSFVLEYTNNHQLKNWYEGFQFVTKWARECPSAIAFQMVNYDLVKKPEWAMRVIENATTGDPSSAAYLMVEGGHAKPEWAMKVIENATTGDPSSAAYLMVEDGYAPQEWYDKVKELKLKEIKNEQ